jgi:hypothetical protein
LIYKNKYNKDSITHITNKYILTDSLLEGMHNDNRKIYNTDNLEDMGNITLDNLNTENELKFSELKFKYNKFFNLENIHSVELEINPNYEEINLEILSQKIPIILKNLSKETEGDNLIEKRETIKNRYRNFLESFNK